MQRFLPIAIDRIHCTTGIQKFLAQGWHKTMCAVIRQPSTLYSSRRLINTTVKTEKTSKGVKYVYIYILYKHIKKQFSSTSLPFHWLHRLARISLACAKTRCPPSTARCKAEAPGPRPLGQWSPVIPGHLILSPAASNGCEANLANSGFSKASTTGCTWPRTHNEANSCVCDTVGWESGSGSIQQLRGGGSLKMSPVFISF